MAWSVLQIQHMYEGTKVNTLLSSTEEMTRYIEDCWSWKLPYQAGKVVSPLQPSHLPCLVAPPPNLDATPRHNHFCPNKNLTRQSLLHGPVIYLSICILLRAHLCPFRANDGTPFWEGEARLRDPIAPLFFDFSSAFPHFQVAVAQSSGAEVFQSQAQQAITGINIAR